MTETLQRPAASVPPQPEPTAFLQRPLVVGARWALTAAVLGVLVVALPVVAAWASDPRTTATFADCARTAGSVWLAAHGAALDLPDGRFDLAPLGLTLLPLALLVRGGRAASLHRRATSVRSAAAAAASVAVPYAALCAGVAALSATAALRPSVVSAALAGLLTGLVGAGAGALRPDRLWRAAWLRLGPRTRRTLPAAVAARLHPAGRRRAARGRLAARPLRPRHRPRRADRAGRGGRRGPAAARAVVRARTPSSGEPAGSPARASPSAPARPSGRSPTSSARCPRSRCWRRCRRAGSLPGSACSRSASRWLPARSPDACCTAGPTPGSRTRAALDVLATAGWSGAAAAVLALLAGGSAGGARLAELGPSATRLGLAVAAEVAVGRARRRRAAATASATVRAAGGLAPDAVGEVGLALLLGLRVAAGVLQALGEVAELLELNSDTAPKTASAVRSRPSTPRTIPASAMPPLVASPRLARPRPITPRTMATMPSRPPIRNRPVSSARMPRTSAATPSPFLGAGRCSPNAGPP